MRQDGSRYGRGMVVAGMLAVALSGWSQMPESVRPAEPVIAPESLPAAPVPQMPTSNDADLVAGWEGKPVRRISFDGVTADRLGQLAGHLSQAEGAALNRESLKASLRQLFATGLYQDVQVEASPLADGVALEFRGAQRAFIGTVTVDGAKGGTLNTQLERSSQLATGTRYNEAKLERALKQMRQTLVVNGFNDPTITQTLTPVADEQLVDIAFHVVPGPQARVGKVQVSGDAGMSVEEFCSHARLRAGQRMDHDTVSRALAGVLKQYRKQERLEAEIKVDSQKYVAATKTVDLSFSANRGPIVKVLVQGAKLSADRVKHVIPVYEEGAVDDDLLNEGNRRLRDYYQRMGYFDVKVDHAMQTVPSGPVTILYTVRMGDRRRVERVSVEGNKYFDSATLKDLLSVHSADSIDRHGAYSQALVNGDINALEAVYRNNGFSNVKVTSGTHAKVDASRKTAPLEVIYSIEEGSQQRVGSVRLEGVEQTDHSKLLPLMNTAAGQLLSPQNLAGDRDTLVTDYLSRGFESARVEVTQQTEADDASKVDVVFHITEGTQIFVHKVLVRGLDKTRPGTVTKAITLHPGDPLNQTALQQTQRNLYDFALFNEVDTVVENPAGGETSKTVLLQVAEARRWTLTYGFGFEAQTGTPQNNCQAAKAGGVPCNPNGKTGPSPRILGDITRNSLFGRDQSVSLRGTYGLLEQKLDLTFQNPHFEGNRNFGLTISAGYANSLDVSTFVASKLEGSMRWTQHFDTPGSLLSKANTLIYEFDFRSVKVKASSLQVAPSEIAELSKATRVAGPAITWIRDTRDSPLDAHHGTYTSFQDFFSGVKFGAQAEFNRLDVSNSNYFSFSKGRFVLARNTRYGQERAFGADREELIPLPERLYAGGASSLRSFGSNSAGPRDPETGYPIGGAGALINSTELRLPPPTLPLMGNSLSFVLFHDMGNVFTNAGEAWASALRVTQQHRETCTSDPPPTDPIQPLPSPTGPVTSTGQLGSCNFNYFSHAPGLGLRYHTPVGPLRLDFSYNLNPPIYPVNINYSLSLPGSEPHSGHAGHFNFFFSFGQTF